MSKERPAHAERLTPAYLIGVKEMAALASVADKTIRRWIDRRWIRRAEVRVRRVLVRRDEFLRFLDGQRGQQEVRA